MTGVHYCSVQSNSDFQEVIGRMKKSVQFAVIMVVLCAGAWAQENKYEVTVQGSGFFPKETTKGSVINKPTYSGGFMSGFRFNLNNRFAIEGDYDYFRNGEKYILSSGTTRIPMNTSAVTGVGIVKLPALRNLKPFALAGAGLTMFNPRNTRGLESQTKGTFVYGGGLDVPMFRHVALRAQYRGFVYKIPDFNTSNLKTDKFTHAVAGSNRGLLEHDVLTSLFPPNTLPITRRPLTGPPLAITPTRFPASCPNRATALTRSGQPHAYGLLPQQYQRFGSASVWCVICIL